MRNVFVDTNILIDLLADRPPFSKFAIEIFNLAEKDKVKLFTSSHTFVTCHYVLKKFIGEKELRQVLHTLLDYISIVSVDLSIIKKSLLSNHKDFEDAIQIFAANAIKNVDFIVTRNLRDFKKSGITTLPPDELVRQITAEI